MTEEKKQDIIDRYNRLESTPEIAKAYNCSRQYISAMLKKWGVKSNNTRSRRILNNKEIVIEMIKAGNKYEDIKNITGVSCSTISRIRRENGITMHHKRDFPCPRCGSTEYIKNGAGYICRKCNNERSNRFYHNNEEKCKEWARKYYHEHKEELYAKAKAKRVDNRLKKSVNKGII